VDDRNDEFPDGFSSLPPFGVRSDGKPVPPVVLAAWKRVRNAHPPAFCDLIQARGTRDKIENRRRLAMLCLELSTGNRRGGFILSQHDAAAVLGVDQGSVSDWLRDLVVLRLIVRTRRGSKQTGKASEYEWVQARRRKPSGTTEVAARPLPA